MHPQPQPTNHPDPHRAVVDRLIDAGLQIVDEAVALSKIPAPPQTKAQLVTEAAAAYDRVSRAIRRAILLAEHLDDPADRAQKRTAARKRILREVEDHIQDEAERPETRERLQAELLDRLDSPDILDEIDTRPVADIISDIIHDLCVDLRPPGMRAWKRRTPADIVLLCTRAASPPGTLDRASPPQPGPHPNPAPDPAPDDPPPTTEELQRFFHDVLTPRLE